MMNWTLEHDEPSGELRLRAVDFWDGKHERREWRVLREDGSVIKRRGDLSGRTVYSEGGGAGFYILRSDYLHEYIKAEDIPVVDERIPCVRVENRRRKCQLCLAAQAA